MRKVILVLSIAIAFGFSMNTAAQSQASQQGAPTVKTGAALKAKANTPAPSATAKNQSQKTSGGKGKVTAKASAPSSYWTEEVDIHDDSSAETTEFLYDAQRGIVYAYGEDDFSCANGKPERAGILEAVYAAGNKAGKPMGSGYYVVGLNAGQCAAKKAGAYACKFNADGNPTECGAIAVNEADFFNNHIGFRPQNSHANDGYRINNLHAFAVTVFRHTKVRTRQTGSSPFLQACYF